MTRVSATPLNLLITVKAAGKTKTTSLPLCSPLHRKRGPGSQSVVRRARVPGG